MLRMFLVLSIVVFAYGCKQNGSNNSTSDSTVTDNVSVDNNNNTQDNIEFEMLQFDPTVVSKLSGVEGDLLYGYKWKDKAGLNLLVFTRATGFESWNDPDCNGCGDQYVYLKVYHFAGTEDSYSLVRLIQDGNQDGCGDPPFGLECDFYDQSISITDLDKDGYAEATFMYHILCASELTPVPTKLMMIENGEKYAIRGDSYIPDFQMGGEKNIDFGDDNNELLQFASQTWDKFCKPNPNGNSSTTTTDDFAQFWTTFQAAIASNSKQQLLNLCTNDMKDFLNTQYSSHVNDKMKTDVANTTANDVKNISITAEVYSDTKRIYFYVEHYGDPQGVGSSFGFWFEKINGKWMVTQPQIGG